VCRHATGIRYGPRVIDLDICLYGSATLDDIDTPEGPLSVPHKLMLQRTFVLGPLCDVAPEMCHPSFYGGKVPLKECYARLCASETAEAVAKGVAPPRLPMRVLPVSKNITWELNKTYVMGILNITPDSFSDGGKNLAVNDAIANAWEMVQAGADILDLGAESTRPGADRVTEEEELQRLLPVVLGIRASRNKLLASIPLSIDTTRAVVARASIQVRAMYFILYILSRLMLCF
jgi:hypothetical protein